MKTVLALGLLIIATVATIASGQGFGGSSSFGRSQGFGGQGGFGQGGFGQGGSGQGGFGQGGFGQGGFGQGQFGQRGQRGFGQGAEGFGPNREYLPPTQNGEVPGHSFGADGYRYRNPSQF